MIETAVGFITEAGVVGLGFYFLKLILNERVVMGSRFREIQEDRDLWRTRAQDLETKIFEGLSDQPRTK